MKNIRTLSKLIRLVAGKRILFYFGTIFCFSFFESLFQILVSFTIGNLFSIARQHSSEKLIPMLVSSLLLGILIIAGTVVFCILYNNEAKRAGAVLMEFVYQKCLRLPVAYYEKQHSGDFMSKLTYDIQKAGGIFGSRLRRVLMPVFMVIFCAIPMFLLCPPVMAGIFVFCLLSLLFDFLMVYPMKRISQNASVDNQIFTKHLISLLQGIEVVKMYSVKAPLMKKYHSANHSLEKSLQKTALLQATAASLSQALDFLCTLSFLALGIWYIEQQKTNLNSLISIYLLYGTFSWNFLQIGKCIPDLADCLVSGQKLLDFLDEPEESACFPSTSDSAFLSDNTAAAKSDLRKTVGSDSKNISDLVISNLCFTYPGSNKEVLNHVSLSAVTGELIAVTGQSGRGKSTLGRLLLGFYPADSGDILINGISIYGMDLKDLRQQIAYVPQDPYLFQGTIADNIACGRPDASKEDIIRAATAAHAHTFIMEQPEQYDTPVGEGGCKFSGGERQRIAIARAFLKNAPILLMDEATSALDHQSEALIQDALLSARKNRIVLIIAHRPSTIAAADRVVPL